MHVTLVGMGNIGSHASGFLARMPNVDRMTLIDRDVYSEANGTAQAMRRGDAGKPKVIVQARRLRELRPDIKIIAIHDDVENVPAGRLATDLLAAAVDTRIARQYLGQMCWGLGVPWIDSGVNAGGGLVSVSTYLPGGENACIECDWADRHYETLEAAYPCAPDLPVARTNAPASLGGLAGALLAIECGKVLTGIRDQSLAGRQLVYDTLWHKQHIVSKRRNPGCRFGHRMLPVATALVVFHGAPLAEIFAMTELKDVRVSVVGARGFAVSAYCSNCDKTYRDLWKVVRRPRCPRCKQALTITGFDMATELTRGDLPAAILRRPLSKLGLLSGDVLVLRGAGAEECVRLGAVDD